MSATKRLRALLDERGVEWEDMSIRLYACTSWRDPDGEPCTALEGADDIPDGKLSAQALLTPEQAIAATLGSCNCSNNCTSSERTETCELTDNGLWGYPYVCSACGASFDADVNGGDFNFCPNCGAKVVDDG